MISRQYDVAQVCLNGHLMSDRSQSRPEVAKKFCPDCGASTITHCPECNAAIQGALHTTYVTPSRFANQSPRRQTMSEAGSVRGFCHSCGKPYPWTKAGIEAAQALAQEQDELTDADKILLQASIPDLVTDTPRTSVAVVRFKKLMLKVGTEAAAGFKNILVNVITEAVKKQLWP